MLGAEKVGRRKQNQRGPRSQEGDSLVGKTNLSNKSDAQGVPDVTKGKDSELGALSPAQTLG